MQSAAGAALVAAACLLVAAAIGIVVPAPTRALLPLSVGGPEVSAWFLVGAALLALLSLAVPAGPSKRVALVLILSAAAMAARPLTQIPTTSQQIDDSLQSALGADYLTRIDLRPQRSAAPRRQHPDLFAGLPAGAAPPVVDVGFALAGWRTPSVRVYRPPASGGPVVVQIYGGSWQRGSPADDPTLAGYLADRGYAVFAVDYRHAPAWRWPAQLEDVQAAVAWVRAHAREYGGDASRMAIIGRSAGAYLALMAAYRSAGPAVQSVVSLYGPSDLTRGYREQPRPDPIDVRTTLEALTGGTPDTMPERYREASPITYASARQPATLQIIGARDHIVLPRFAHRLDRQLRDAGNVSVLIELPWADHAFDAVPFGPGGQMAIYATERFLAATLIGR